MAAETIDQGGASDLRGAKSKDGTGIRTHRAGTKIPAVLVTRSEEGAARVVVGLYGLQRFEVSSAGRHSTARVKSPETWPRQRQKQGGALQKTDRSDTSSLWSHHVLLAFPSPP